ncbi:toll/interleukin-1 receptor domain-containing protein, partial [Nocardia beijingensis]|uniref:toll/interleukin-1 receptor domain-containing protein n=1 Tax=Nocardia beijingensis TaxID=95162 RepID=UPI0014719A71
MSYSHRADKDLAPDLQRALGQLAKPWNQPRALRVFRDRTDLATASDLTAEIEDALARSRYFLLLACPESARSEWVGKEVEYWKRHKSPESFLIAVTDGAAVWNGGDFEWPASTALPQSLRGYFAAVPLWEDLSFARDKDRRSLRHSEFRSAVASLASKPRGVPKRQLDSEDVRQHRRATRVREAGVAALVVLLVAAVVAGLGFLVQRNEARQQRDIAVARELVSRSRLLTVTDPFGSRLTALAAWRIAPTPETRHALLDVAHNPRTVVLTGHTSSVGSVVFAPGGRTLATGSADGARLWDTTTRQPIGSPLTGQTGGVTSVAFGPDGRTLATGGKDRTVRLWDTATRQPIGDLITGQTGGVTSVAFGPDG